MLTKKTTRAEANRRRKQKVPLAPYYTISTRVTEERGSRLRALTALRGADTIKQMLGLLIDEAWTAFPDHATRDRALAAIAKGATS
jgi:hypothetical protein